VRDDDLETGVAQRDVARGAGLIGCAAHRAQVDHQRQPAALQQAPQPGQVGRIQARAGVETAQAGGFGTLELDPLEGRVVEQG
jgi:hypothetical protein